MVVVVGGQSASSVWSLPLSGKDGEKKGACLTDAITNGANVVRARPGRLK